ncbi:MAG: ketopantoate reductase family protein [Solirubrobacteraceae bacterium]
MTVAILGPGGVGGFLAGALDRAGVPVTVVARPATAAYVAEHGLRVRSTFLGETFAARPPVEVSLEEPVDVLLIAVKATGLAAALGRVRVEPGLVVPLLNGLGHREVLRERFGGSAVAGTIRVESDRPEPGVIVQSSPFLRVEVACDDPARRPALAALVELLERAGVPGVVGLSEAQVTWSKLSRLCPLALATTAYDRPIGPIRSTPELRADLRACVEEACAVARAEGAAVEPAETMRELDAAHPDLGSSMQRDVRAGREPELDAIAWPVVRAGESHGVPTPTISRLAERIGS